MRLQGLLLLCLALPACQRDRDSYLVLRSDIDCDVPRVFQLRVTITNNGSVDQKTVPAVASAELDFPSSLTLILPGSRRGAVDILVEAIDEKRQAVGQGTVGGEIVSGERTDLQVQIKASYVPVCGNGVVDSGEECDDGNTSSGDGCGSACRWEARSVDGGSPPDGGVSNQTGPDAAAGSAFLQMDLGAQFSCAVRADTTVWCWGNNTYGQLRLPGTATRLTPNAAAGVAWVTVASGQTHACGIRRDGTMSCWGNNASGQLGLASPRESNQQVEVTGGPWQSVAAGSYQSCALASDSTLWCWGNNINGQLGAASDIGESPQPLQVPGPGWTQVSSNFLHSCAVKQDSTLWCWGLNADLQLADAMVSSRYAPGEVTGGGWTSVTTGLYHTCATKHDGSLWCWGGNAAGQLGNTTVPAQPGAKTAVPTQVAGTWASVTAGQTHTCGLMTDQTLWCWGDNAQGQLGSGSGTAQALPTPVVVAGQTWNRVAAGLAHTCALGNGSLWCWGANSDGQLGVGSNLPRPVPALVGP